MQMKWYAFCRFLIEKRASDVIAQTNSDKQNGMVEDLKLFQASLVSKCS